MLHRLRTWTVLYNGRMRLVERMGRTVLHCTAAHCVSDRRRCIGRVEMKKRRQARRMLISRRGHGTHCVFCECVCTCNGRAHLAKKFGKVDEVKMSRGFDRGKHIFSIFVRTKLHYCIVLHYAKHRSFGPPPDGGWGGNCSCM